MNDRQYYGGLDRFRVIAALLIVAIHTSPLLSVSEMGDFILTRVIARIAVPFFFMATGFFLLPEYMDQKKINSGKLRRFLKKAVILYGIAILLYLPLNIYAGYFNTTYLLANLFKDIVFDGTFYHLWYLPAVIMGAVVTCWLVGKLKTHQVLGITFILYMIGLFGDNYYGVAAKVPLLKSFYDTVFFISDYTRNGLFFAPIFLMIGGLTAKYRGRRLKPCLIGFGVSLVLMLGEGLILHGFQIQRHDSMYLMLLPCMIFLSQSLLFWKKASSQSLRNLSMMIYLIHPVMIVLVRGFAKGVNLQQLFIDNSIVHFMAVAVSSFAVAKLFLVIKERTNKNKTSFKKVSSDRAWAEINLENLRNNVKVLCEALPNGCELMAVVKANAYGHGDVEIGRYLNLNGVNSFAVATIDEGIRLRTHGIKGDILILGYTDPRRISELARYGLSQTVADYQHAKQLNDLEQQISVHIKIDTGMHRLGECCNHIREIERIFHFPNLKICGIYSHLCAADSTQTNDIAFTEGQLKHFHTLLEQLKQHCIPLPKIHVQSSYGFLNYPTQQCGYARIGIALYGTLSSPDHKTKLQLNLRPVLSLKTRVILVRSISAGESVGYGQAFTPSHNARIVVLSIGYADGVPRSLSCGKGEVLIHGCRAPIIGRICMDQLMVDITDISDVKVGDTATLIGKDGTEQITAEEVAEASGTITNEVLSRLGERLERVY